MQLHQCLLWQCCLQDFRGDRLHGAAHSQPVLCLWSLVHRVHWNSEEKILEFWSTRKQHALPCLLFLRKMSCVTAWHTEVGTAGSKLKEAPKNMSSCLLLMVFPLLVFPLMLSFWRVALGVWISCFMSNSPWAFYVCSQSGSEFSILLFEQDFKNYTLFRHCHLDMPNWRQLFPSVDYFLSPFMDSA